MRLFLDTSVLLAAAGSASGGSRLIFSMAATAGWKLLTSHYCVAEPLRNLSKLPHPEAGETVWKEAMVPALELVADVWSSELPLVFPVPKDRPVLLSALANGDWLLTLDRADFDRWLGRSVYHLSISTPARFLGEMRSKGII